jgi:site-specific DNA-methyltransferase (adenine-specific)
VLLENYSLKKKLIGVLDVKIIIINIIYALNKTKMSTQIQPVNGTMEINKIYLGDCLEVMKQIKDNSIDLVITSPPYEDFNGAGYNGQTKDILFLKIYSEFFDKFMKEVFRVLKENGQFYLNLKNKTLKKKLLTPHWIEFTEGFRLFDFKSYIIWKYAGSFDSTYDRFHNDYEIIYHLSKGNDINLNYNFIEKDPLTSIWYIPHFIKDRLHPVQMPEKVAERMIVHGSKKGQLVLDCFMGSGTSAIACINNNRSFIGIELNPKYVEIANNRIKQVLAKAN